MAFSLYQSPAPVNAKGGGPGPLHHRGRRLEHGRHQDLRAGRGRARRLRLHRAV